MNDFKGKILEKSSHWLRILTISGSLDSLIWERSALLTYVFSTQNIAQAWRKAYTYASSPWNVPDGRLILSIESAAADL